MNQVQFIETSITVGYKEWETSDLDIQNDDIRVSAAPKSYIAAHSHWICFKNLYFNTKRSYFFAISNTISFMSIYDLEIFRP